VVRITYIDVEHLQIIWWFLEDMEHNGNGWDYGSTSWYSMANRQRKDFVDVKVILNRSTWDLSLEKQNIGQRMRDSRQVLNKYWFLRAIHYNFLSGTFQESWKYIKCTMLIKQIMRSNYSSLPRKVTLEGTFTAAR